MREYIQDSIRKNSGSIFGHIGMSAIPISLSYGSYVTTNYLTANYLVSGTILGGCAQISAPIIIGLMVGKTLIDNHTACYELGKKTGEFSADIVMDTSANYILKPGYEVGSSAVQSGYNTFSQFIKNKTYNAAATVTNAAYSTKDSLIRMTYNKATAISNSIHESAVNAASQTYNYTTSKLNSSYKATSKTVKDTYYISKAKGDLACQSLNNTASLTYSSAASKLKSSYRSTSRAASKKARATYYRTKAKMNSTYNKIESYEEYSRNILNMFK